MIKEDAERIHNYNLEHLADEFSYLPKWRVEEAYNNCKIKMNGFADFCPIAIYRMAEEILKGYENGSAKEVRRSRFIKIRHPRFLVNLLFKK